MKTHHYLLIICLNILFINIAVAQSHRLTPPTNCIFAKEQATSNFIACPVCSEKEKDEKDFKKELADKKEFERLKYGALAIDRSNGFYFGFAHDYSTRQEAEDRATKECEKKGGNCTVVLVYNGEACASYRTIDASQGNAYGWGVASTREEADQIATREALKRSNGVYPSNHVWSCNSKSIQSAKILFEAADGLPIIAKRSTIESINYVKLSADGMYYTIVDKKGTIQILEIPTFQYVFDSPAGELTTIKDKSRIQAAVLSPDYKFIYAVENNGLVKINFKTKETVARLPFDTYSPRMDISNNGRYIVVTSESRNISNKVIDVEKMQIIGNVNNGQFGMNYVTISPDNKLAALSSIDGSLKFIDITTGRLSHSKHIGGNVQRGQFSTDGSKITMSIFDENDIENSVTDHTRVLDAKTGNVLKKYGLLKSFGYASAFLENNTIVIEADYTGEMKILDYQSGSVKQRIMEKYNFYFIDPIKSGKGFISSGFEGISFYLRNENGQYILKKKISFK